MNEKKSYRKLYRFWIGPLLVGSSLATGYETTHRLMILQSNWQTAEGQFLKKQDILPRKKLDSSLNKRIPSFPNSKNKKFNRSQEKLQRNLAQLEDREMQKLLHALKTSQDVPQKQQEAHQNKNLDLSNTQVILKETNFDQLFKTLPRQ